jgi:hypothetical protein
MATKTKSIPVRCQPAFVAEVRAFASAEGRSVSNALQQLAREGLAARRKAQQGGR